MPQPTGCSHQCSVEIYTYFILIRATLSLMIKGFNNISGAKVHIFLKTTNFLCINQQLECKVTHKHNHTTREAVL